jgi:hypothetical protein
MKKFEIGIYNKKVRELVKIGERHKHLADSWADLHYIEIAAKDEADARAKADRRYPASEGYVIEGVMLSSSDKFA